MTFDEYLSSIGTSQGQLGPNRLDAHRKAYQAGPAYQAAPDWLSGGAATSVVPTAAPAVNTFAGGGGTSTITRSDIRQQHPNWSQNRIATALGQARMDTAATTTPTAGGVAGPGTSNLFDPTAGANTLSKNQLQRKHPNWDASRIRAMMQGQATDPNAAGGVSGLGVTTLGQGNGVYDPMYVGQQGINQANNNPEQYLISLLQNSGIIQGNGTPQDEYLQTAAVAKLNREYEAAKALNQSLTIVDFMQQNYGAGYGPTGLVVGNLTPNAFAQAAQEATMNADPQAAIAAALSGAMMGTGTAQDQWMQQFAQDQLMREFLAAQQASPGLTISQFLQQRGPVDPNAYAAQAQNYFLNQNPEVAINAGIASSGVLGANESSQFRDFVTSDGLDLIRAMMDQGRASDPNYQVEAGGGVSGLMDQIRRAYLMRPDYRQLPSIAPAGGRWSWWA